MASRKKTSTIAANRAAVRAGKIQKPSEKFATVEEVEPTPDSSTKAVSPKPTVAAAPKNLKDPKTQWRILSPEAMRYTLALPIGERVIELRTTFTLADELHRRIYENAEAFRALLGIEISSYNPAYRPGGPIDWVWVAEHREYLDAAMLLSHVRAKARDLVARLSTFIVDDIDADAPVERVKPEHLEEGMDHVQLSAAALTILNAAVEANAARKKANPAKAAPV